MENGVTGTEKYPFLGIKYENDKPKSWAFIKSGANKNENIKVYFFIVNRFVFAKCKQIVLLRLITELLT